MVAEELSNIVLIHCHDLGRFLGCYGVPTVHTPAIDAFVDNAVMFEQAYCTAPQCSPSRAALFTGRYPHCTGVMGLTQPPFWWNMNPGEGHLARILGDAGYETVLVGIHHESKTGQNDVVADRLGFDLVQRHGQRGSDVTALATAQLDRLSAGNRPFYLQVGYLEPHRLQVRERSEPGYQGFIGDYLEPDIERGVTIPPYLIDEPSARVEIGELQGAVRYLDQQVGALLDAIDQRGLTNDTIVIFTTDHGLALPRAKASLYDPGLEIALAIRCPARNWNGGVRRPELVSNVDIVPTLLEAVGQDVSDRIQGASFLSLLQPDSASAHNRDAVFAELTYHDYYDPRRCIRTEAHKLIVNFTVAPTFMDNSAAWRPRTTPKMILTTTHLQRFHPPVELYDLARDPLELTNIAEEPAHSEVVRELLRRLHGWMHETKDPLLKGAVTPPLHTIALTALRTGEVPTDL